MSDQERIGLPTEQGGKASPVSGRSRLLIQLLFVWAVFNLALWFAPELWLASAQRFQDRRRERTAAHYETRTHEAGDSVSFRMPYLFYAPEISVDDRVPLVVVLHGAGERGDDCRSHLTTLGTFLVEQQFQTRHPCYVVAPQCPVNQTWCSSRGREVEQAVAGIVDELIVNESIDASRIYLIGHSMGAFGSWHYLASMPNRFAACLAIAGGGDPADAEFIAGTPVWAIHGTDDTVVCIEQSSRMVEAVVNAKGIAKLTKLSNVGHGSMKVVQQAPQGYIDWLFQHRKYGEPTP